MNSLLQNIALLIVFGIVLSIPLLLILLANLSEKYPSARYITIGIMVLMGLLLMACAPLMVLGALVTPLDTGAPAPPLAMDPLLAAFMALVFAATGAANGSAYKMIPAIWKANGRPGTEASAALGVIGAAGALGGFLIPIAFNTPWVSDPIGATKAAFWLFTGFYLLCAAVTYAVFLSKRSKFAGHCV